MSSSTGSGNGWCLDPHVIDQMTWSVKGVVRARILAPSLAKAEAWPRGPSFPMRVYHPRRGVVWS